MLTYKIVRGPWPLFEFSPSFNILKPEICFNCPALTNKNKSTNKFVGLWLSSWIILMPHLDNFHGNVKFGKDKLRRTKNVYLSVAIFNEFIPWCIFALLFLSLLTNQLFWGKTHNNFVHLKYSSAQALISSCKVVRLVKKFHWFFWLEKKQIPEQKDQKQFQVF